MQRLCGSDESRKVAHQRVGRLKKLSTVEPEVLYFQPGFFPDFPYRGVFFCLTAVHISSHQNIRGLTVLLDEQNFPGLLIHNNHADCHIVHLEPVLLAVLFTFVWPYAQAGINALGGFIRSAGNFGLFIYGTLERLLIPTGLHHLVYTPFLYTSLGGTATVGGQVLEGARNIYYAEIADPSVAVLSQSVIWDARGISKMFGLIGACLAMYQTARPENREKIKPVLITAAVTSFIAGVTEPIEFSFLFVAPILFVVHAVLAGSSFVVLNLLGCRAIGPTGFIDFLLYNLPLGIAKTRWPVYIAVGVLYFFLYYVIFRVLIVKMNLHTLGREAEGMEMKLHSKSESKAKVAAENGTAAAPAADNTVDAAVIVEALGGKDNILKVTNCYTRLRTELADPDKVQDDVLKNQTGASAVIHKGKKD